jgi:hypothetical protein
MGPEATTPPEDEDREFEAHWHAWSRHEEDRAEDDPAPFAPPDGLSLDAPQGNGEELAEEEEEEEDYDEEEEGEEEEDSSPVAAPTSGPAYPTTPCTLSTRQGDCVLSIARRYGFSPDTLWAHPNNADLRNRRKRTILLPGDPVFIPERTDREETVPTGEMHLFRARGLPICRVSVRFLREGEPRASVRYTLTVGGQSFAGETDDDGKVEHRIPTESTLGELVLHDAGGDEIYLLQLGHLNPRNDVAGAQSRLHHLGFGCGPIDGKLGPRTRAALRTFQRNHGLEVTGRLDDPTQVKLEEVHGS